MKLTRAIAHVAAAVLSIAALCDSSPGSDLPPDAIYFNAHITTLDPDRPRAQALAIRGDRLVAVGDDATVLSSAGTQTEKIDVGGKAILPGLIDAHGHLLGLGRFTLGQIDLSATRSFDDVCNVVRDEAARRPRGEWIIGRKWDHESWPDRRLPDHAALSAVSPDHPVWLERVDGHAGIANAAAMKRAGVTEETASPAGGEILKHADGRLTGVFVDRAASLIESKLPDESGRTEAAILKAQALCLAAGLTSVHDPGLSPAEIAAYEALEKTGALKLRVYAMVNAGDAPEYFAAHPPRSGDRLSVRACKAYADGALGSRGAWMIEPYSDRAVDEHGHPYTGLRLASQDELASLAHDAVSRGYQLCVHAIGDGANRAVLNAFEAASRGIEPGNSPRFRIEHAQVISPADIPRFAALGVIASIQPTHCTSDMRWAADRVGASRLAGAYAWKSLQRGGARLAGGSDFPVESHLPWLGIYAAITRQDADGRPPGGWRPEERLTREEALRLFTTDAAYASFNEGRQGLLKAGYWADFVIVDRDVMACPPDQIRTTSVQRTVIGGQAVYSAP